ncbi:MAG TPA: Maf family protein [Bryobacteraceae bacterium]|nr:Maf family protein [Bryobacteraceae bacterium]
MKLVLASQSPRRREILDNAGIAFEVRTSGVPEELTEGESPVQYVQRLAASKAAAVSRTDDEIVLGADTVVVLENKILEKPRDGADAARMLGVLSGRQHKVITGVCLLTRNHRVVDSAETFVSFTRLSAAEIAQYVASGEPMDKAGAYAIQGRASKWLERIDGCYFNVVGLPISLVYRHLKELTSAPSF